MRLKALAATSVIPSPEVLPNESVRAKTASTARSRVRFRPCIDIHQGTVKQIVGGTLKDPGDERSAHLAWSIDIFQGTAIEA